MAKIELTASMLRERFDYDPNTGKFTSKVGRNAGNISDRHDDRGYIQISICGKLYRGGRLAWFYVHGKWPHQIDHINTIRDDDRIANLRDVTRWQNQINSRARREGRIVGVYFGRNRWRAHISINNRDICIGVFKSKELAIEAYQNALKKRCGDFQYDPDALSPSLTDAK